MSKEYILNGEFTMDSNKNLEFKLDTSNATFQNLKDVATSEKGNKTVFYKKEIINGVTVQVTAYVSKKSLEDLENLERTREAQAQARELQELKALLQDPDVLELVRAKRQGRA